MADLARVLSVPLPELLENVEERRIAPERLKLELHLKETARTLSDADLRTALELVEVLAKARGRSRQRSAMRG